MAYEIRYSTAARKSIEKLPRPVQIRVIEKIEALSQNPRPVGSVKLSGEEAFRIRVGDYRVIYTVVDDQLLVLVVIVGHRRDVYR